jgi:putative oxidoreductase
MKLNLKELHIVSKIAIYILAVVLIGIGIFDIRNPYDILVFVPSWLPGGIIWSYIVGACFILVGVSFLTNQYVKITAYTLAAFLFFFILTVHVPNAFNAGMPEMRIQALVNILKDTAIACFALHIAAGAHHQHLHFEEAD